MESPHIIVTNFYSVSFDKKSWGSGYNIQVDDETELTKNLNSYVFSDNETAEYFLNHISPRTHYIRALPMPWNWNISGSTLYKALRLFNHWFNAKQRYNSPLESTGKNFGCSDVVFQYDVSDLDWKSRLSHIEEYENVVNLTNTMLESGIKGNDKLLSSMAYILMYLGNTELSSTVYNRIDTTDFSDNVPHEMFARHMSLVMEKKFPLLPMLQRSILPVGVPISNEIRSRFLEYISETMHNIVCQATDRSCFRLDDKRVIQILGKIFRENDEKLLCSFIRAVIVLDDRLLKIINYVLRNRDVGYTDLGSAGKEIIRHYLVKKFVTSDRLGDEMDNFMSPDYNERYEKLIKMFLKEKIDV